MPVRSIRRIGRFAATLGVVSALVLSPLTAQAILIHDHLGHDTHSHTLSAHELDKLQSDPEHQHEEHEHDGAAVDSAHGEGSSFVILLGLPEGLVRGRVLPGGRTVVARCPSMPCTDVVAIVSQQPDRSCTSSPSSIAPPMRARSLLQGILLTSHALLL